MKVLQINNSDHQGGAAIAGYRLHQGLLNQNIDSHLLVGSSTEQCDRVTVIPSQAKIEKLVASITRPLGLNYVNLLSSFALGKHNLYQAADILNFHNLHGGYFNYLAIPAITKAKPAVWTLHDMWGFTGHCVYSLDCDRWKTGCGNCPYPHSYPVVQTDNTHWEWKLKNWVYNRANLVIVTLSKWLTKQVQQSLLSHFPIHHIPNGIDTDAYQPIDPQLCRTALDIPPHKKVLMFGAQSLADSRKGGDLLVKALQGLPASLKQEIILLTMGNCSREIGNTLGMKTINIGYIDSDRIKSIAYSASDLFVFPTRADNLPLVLQESMACATPMVSFEVGGVPDLVRPGITGYLAKPQDTQDFSNGIVQLLEDKNLRQQMSQNCREIILNEYSLATQTKHYINLYRQILQGDCN
ncbi:glycosyltransferase [Xenococcus sp. PCC 7305]|uniref:glycosyltransferase family 4 protein n=1 Tax=Xenococcus sp. PCC 7305 TaxID=102125 RepID=UPI0002ABF6C9|nr:glycosyltransferase family 4 protein [Xenococcus sp. PCC 7305]ELS02156.1 glycosyltransferase [Xenococcus sp. PCC 7305]